MPTTTGRAACAQPRRRPGCRGVKPIWFTELGCAAVDKGANQPNIFGDPKSAESGRPYFSSGAPDALMQRQVLRAHLAYRQATGRRHNPASASMRTHGRCGPHLPLDLGCAALSGLSRTDRDLERRAQPRTGHWLTGRLGALASDELAAAIAADYGVALARSSRAAAVGQGYALEGVVPAAMRWRRCWRRAG